MKSQGKTPADVPTRAMVLAAGLGTRMKPLTDTLPKPLLEVAGATLIDHVLDRLEEAEVSHVIVNAHHLAEQGRSRGYPPTLPRVAPGACP